MRHGPIAFSYGFTTTRTNARHRLHQRSDPVNLPFKSSTAFAGLTLSLALLGGCSSEEAAPEAAPATPASPAPSSPAPSTTPAVAATKRKPKGGVKKAESKGPKKKRKPQK